MITSQVKYFWFLLDIMDHADVKVMPEPYALGGASSVFRGPIA